MKSFQILTPLLLLCFAWAAFAPPARAQFICHIAESMNNGQGTLLGDYWYTALSCRGNEAIAAATVEAHTSTPGYFLAFFVSRDGGATWNVETQGLPAPTWNYQPKVERIDQIDSLNIIANGDSGLLIRSTDGGSTWGTLAVPTTHPVEDISFSDPMNGMFVAADTVNATYVTTDGGSSWTPVPFTRPYAWECHAYGNGVYRIFTIGSGILYTTKDNWNTVDSSPVIADTGIASKYEFNGCSFGGVDTLFAYGGHHTSQFLAPYISMTTNGGKEWVTVYDDSSSLWHSGKVSYLSDIRRDTIVASGNLLHQVIQSTDHGKTWKSDTLIYSDSDFVDAGNSGVGLSSDEELIISFNNGFTSSLVVGSHESLSVAHNSVTSKMLQLFPNPAASVLEITGASPGGRVLLLDMLGREVLQAKTPASGTLTLDVSHLPRGEYMIVLGEHGKMVPAGQVVLTGE